MTRPTEAWRSGQALTSVSVGDPVIKALDKTDAVDMADIVSVQGQGDLQFEAAATAGNNNGNIFGGQIIGQAIMAAQATVSRPLHALTARFLVAGAPGFPLRYYVSAIRDGGSFSGRRVSVCQQDRELVVIDTAYQAPEAGFDYQADWGAAPPSPESLEVLARVAARYDQVPQRTLRALARHKSIEIRPTNPDSFFQGHSRAPLRFWARARVSLAERPELWAAGLGYISDYLAASPGVMRHSDHLFNPETFGTTLNHSLWIHRAADPSDWLYCEGDCHWSGAGRTLNTSRIYTANGRLVSTTVQEALLRRRTTKSNSTTADETAA